MAYKIPSATAYADAKANEITHAEAYTIANDKAKAKAKAKAKEKAEAEAEAKAEARAKARIYNAAKVEAEAKAKAYAVAAAKAKAEVEVFTPLYDLATDCLQLSMHFFHPIQQCAQQVYHTAVPLSPTSSWLHKSCLLSVTEISYLMWLALQELPVLGDHS